jgi:hypothetical protein
VSDVRLNIWTATGTLSSLYLPLFAIRRRRLLILSVSLPIIKYRRRLAHVQSLYEVERRQHVEKDSWEEGCSEGREADREYLPEVQKHSENSVTLRL